MKHKHTATTDFVHMIVSANGFVILSKCAECGSRFRDFDYEKELV